MIKHYLTLIIALLISQPGYAADQRIDQQNAGYETVKVNNQLAFRAYVAGPVESKQGLLLIHGWRGLNQGMEIWANQFAVQGYRVMAVDLYNNQVATNPTKARQLMNNLDQQEANQKFRKAVSLLSQTGRKVAVLGRSFGANQAIQAASANKNDISAVVLYYPFGDVATGNPSLASIKAPVLGNFADKDFFFDQERRQKFISVAKDKGIRLEVEMYSARHGFSNIFGHNFDANVNSSSSKKTFSFLAQHLR